MAVEVVLADPVALGEDDDRAALRGLVGERGHLRRLGQLLGRSTPGIGMNSTASRLPRVIVPVLSSSSTSQSPEASTARPERARTLRRTSRSMPAIPIAESRAPIVVGISATSRAIRVVSESSVPAKSGEGAQRDDDDDEDQGQRRRAGCRARSRSGSCAARRPRPGRSSGRGRTCPGSWVISTTIRSESTLVPPVTARAVAAGLADHRRRLAGDRRLVDRGDPLDHGAVAGDRLARLDDDDVAADAARRRASRRRRAGCAVVSVRIARRLAAWARPRPSASASARLAKTTVSQSQTAIVKAEPGRLVAAAERRAAEDLDQPGDGGDRRRRSRPRTSPGCGPGPAGRACAPTRAAPGRRISGSKSERGCVSAVISAAPLLRGRC